MNRVHRYLSFCGLIFLLASCHSAGSGDQVCFRQHCYRVEIADNGNKRMRGLQHRAQLPADAGMLFIFPESGRHAFWMKDALIPLDMIWLDSSRKVVHIETGAQPCSGDICPNYTPSMSALYVLELNAGQVKKNGIKLGDQAKYRLSKI